MELNTNESFQTKQDPFYLCFTVQASRYSEHFKRFFSFPIPRTEHGKQVEYVNKISLKTPIVGKILCIHDILPSMSMYNTLNKTKQTPETVEKHHILPCIRQGRVMMDEFITLINEKGNGRDPHCIGEAAFPGDLSILRTFVKS